MTAVPEPRDADDLSHTSFVVAHCGRPMHFRNSLTTREGKPRAGAETTTTTRTCECGAELITTLRRPA